MQFSHQQDGALFFTHSFSLWSSLPLFNHGLSLSKFHYDLQFSLTISTPLRYHYLSLFIFTACSNTVILLFPLAFDWLHCWIGTPISNFILSTNVNNYCFTLLQLESKHKFTCTLDHLFACSFISLFVRSFCLLVYLFNHLINHSFVHLFVCLLIC